MPDIFVDPTATTSPVIKVDGICYKVVGNSKETPEVDSEDIQDEYEGCGECCGPDCTVCGGTGGYTDIEVDDTDRFWCNSVVAKWNSKPTLATICLKDGISGGSRRIKLTGESISESACVSWVDNGLWEGGEWYVVDLDAYASLAECEGNIYPSSVTDNVAYDIEIDTTAGELRFWAFVLRDDIGPSEIGGILFYGSVALATLTNPYDVTLSNQTSSAGSTGTYGGRQGVVWATGGEIRLSECCVCLPKLLDVMIGTVSVDTQCFPCTGSGQSEKWTDSTWSFNGQAEYQGVSGTIHTWIASSSVGYSHFINEEDCTGATSKTSATVSIQVDWDESDGSFSIIADTDDILGCMNPYLSVLFSATSTVQDICALIGPLNNADGSDQIGTGGTATIEDSSSA